MPRIQQKDRKISEDGQRLWRKTARLLKKEIGEKDFRCWLAEIKPVYISSKRVDLGLSSEFMKNSVKKNYGERIRRSLEKELPSLQDLQFVCLDHLTKKEEHDDRVTSEALDAETVMASDDAVANSELQEINGKARSLGTALDRRYIFDTFVVGKPNEFAFACARRVADHPASDGLNPLVLHGNVGLGKTHLLHSIAAELMENGYKDVIYMSAENFTYLFVSALRNGTIIDFKDQLRSSDVLILDDVQFLLNKDSTQEEFFNTFNAIVGDGRQIVLSADKPPTDFPGLEDRLRSRLCSGMVADIHATTFELRLAILMNKVAASGITVPRKVQEYLAHKITSSVRELEAALNRLIAYSQMTGQEISFETLNLDFMQDLLKPQGRRVTIEEIQAKVSQHYNIRQAEMTSGRRARNVARPRQVAMYLSKELTSQSLPEIGRKFGNRDHTTVMHAVKKVSDLLKKEKDFAEDVELLRRMLEG